LKKALVFILTIISTLLFCSCTAQMPDEEIPVSADTSLTRTGFVYCTDGKYLVPVRIETQLGENTAQQLAACMQNTSADMYGLSSIVPNGAEISVIQEENIAKVSITGDVSQMDGEKIICSVVNTLTQCGGIDAVSFSVNGLSDTFGGVDITEPIGEYCINPAYEIGDLEPFRVFFQNDAGLVIPMTKATNAPSAEVYIKALMTVPDSASELTSLFPADTKLNSAVLADGTLSLDFSGEFYGISATPQAEENLISAINSTCRQLDGVESVRIYVDGIEYASRENAAEVFANYIEK